MAKTGTWRWLVWWVVQPADLSQEVDRYSDRNPFKTARGVSACFLVLSVAITLAMVAFKVMPASAILDATISLTLAVFIYLGHRWAMLLAMGWWTLEKVLMLVDFQHINGGTAITQVIWWAIYMHAFWLAFRVEQSRRKPPATVVHAVSAD